MVRCIKVEVFEICEQIIDVVECVFYRKGVFCIFLNDIVEEVGVIRGVIYWYFKNKYDVFVVMMEWYCLFMEFFF